MYAVVLVLNANATQDLKLIYKIREGNNCLPGMLYKISIKNRQESGLILRLQKQYKGNYQLKYLGEAQAAEPILTRQGLALVRWLSRHYVCSLNRAVGLFVPPSVRSKQEFRYFIPSFVSNDQTTIQTQVQGSKQQMTFFDPAWQFLWDALKKAGAKGMSASRIKNRWNLKTLEQVEELYKKGLLIKEENWIQKRKGLSKDAMANPLHDNLSLQLEPAQLSALDKIKADISEGKFGHHLIYGVTGSGKTEVYLQAAEQVIASGKQVIYLVPEISLVPQLVAKSMEWFDDKVAVLHSNLTPAQRSAQWQRIRHCEASLIIGPRSAIFAPVQKLGLIIIDEEHEHTYKQNEPEPRYDARDTAEHLAHLWKAIIIRGSATPDVSTFYRAKQGEITLSCLPDRVQKRPMPPIQWIDMKKEMKEGHPYPVSRPLLNELKYTIQRGEQAILLMNRRGFHTYVLCKDCGHRLECPRCSIALTYHRDIERGSGLICHYCNYRQNLPERCPHCGSPALQYMGTGTERVVDYLTQQLPQAKILRMDFDSTRRAGSHTEILRAFQKGEANVLVGTQMVAKGFDFAKVTLAAVLHIDGIMNIPDFSSSEKAFQLMIQTAGRAGRGSCPGKVIVQTFFLSNPVLQYVDNYDYDGFYNNEVSLRQALGYPPFRKMARILVSGKQLKEVNDFLERLIIYCKDKLQEQTNEIVWLGPGNAPLERVKDRWRCHVVLVSSHFAVLRRCLILANSFTVNMDKDLRLMVDMEPKSLL